MGVADKLAEIVGEEWVSTSPSDLYIYSFDMTENPPHEPEWIVMPSSVEEIRSILLLANEEKIPVTPVVAGANVGGLAIPLKGGIVLDLKRMDRVKINEREMYAIVEPGVTFGHLKAYLKRNFPRLTYSYPLAPPFTSVMCNALLEGLTNLSHRYGAMGDWINGMEVVLPTGQLVKVGSCAVSDSWFSRAPLPDLAGLFIGWQGTTGIVTKLGVQLFPEPKFKLRILVFAMDKRSNFELMRRASRLQIFDDVASVSWPAARLLLGGRGKLTRAKGEPEFFLFFELSGNSEKEIEAKKSLLEELVEMEKVEPPIVVDDFLGITPKLAKFVDLPTTLDFLLEKGGLTWVGSYGPPSRWEEATEDGFRIMESYDFPPILVTRAMNYGHFGVLRFIIPFEKREEEIERVRKLCSELCRMVLSKGFVPYKIPPWAVPLLMEKADKGWINLLKRIKAMLDPAGIMNPGKLGL
jgi:glycolate oxidase